MDGAYGPFQVQVRSGTASFSADEPMGSGGLSAGPTPFDLLGGALGSCALMTMRLYAREHGWALEHVAMRITHDRPALFARDHFLIEVQLTGELTETQMGELIAVSERSPVRLTMGAGADIETRLMPAGLIEEAASSRAMHLKRMHEAVRRSAASLGPRNVRSKPWT